MPHIHLSAVEVNDHPVSLKVPCRFSRPELSICHGNYNLNFFFILCYYLYYQNSRDMWAAYRFPQQLQASCYKSVASLVSPHWMCIGLIHWSKMFPLSLVIELESHPFMIQITFLQGTRTSFLDATVPEIQGMLIDCWIQVHVFTER